MKRGVCSESNRRQRLRDCWKPLSLKGIRVLPGVLAFAVFALTAQSGLAQASKAKPVGSKSSQAGAGQSLSIEKFLDQVRSGNGAFQSSDQTADASELTARSAELALAPQLQTSYSMISDARLSPFFPFQRTDLNTVNFSIAKKFETGIQGRFGFDLFDTTYVGIRPRFFEARPQIEASVPLWRNFWGRETRQSVEAGMAAGRAQAEESRARADAILNEAENLYWRLALAKENVKVAQDALSRAQAIDAWTKRRVDLSLSDRSENLQAIAQLKARQLDLLLAQESERSARLAFNAARGKAGDEVTEQITSLNLAEVQNWNFNDKQLGTRADIRAALLAAEAGEASAVATSEQSKPNLEVFAGYTLNSPLVGTSQLESINEAINSRRPTTTVGVRFSMPLDFGLNADLKQGHLAKAQANRILADRKKFELERDFSDLKARLEVAKEKVKMYESVEVAQKERLDHERDRQKQGRSTLSQVILFENEYQLTQAARLGSLSEALALRAQLKLYSTNGTKESVQ